MKILNKALLISFLICIGLLICLFISITSEIGDLSMNKKTDNPNFHTTGHIYQYYQSGAKYKGERKAVKAFLIENKFDVSAISDGWITIRFVVNYKGVADRFRFFCINNDYKVLQLSSKLEKDLLKAVKSLNNWEVGKVNEKDVNSYYQITLKIENGKIIDIF